MDLPYGFLSNDRGFSQHYLCYPVSFLPDRNSEVVEKGDKIIMPPSALDQLARLRVTYPMLFRVRAESGRSIHCGVLEFIAEEGSVFMPFWMMQNLGLHEGGLVEVTNVNLSKGTFVKFQPQTSNFLDISNHKAVLESTLRNYSALTKGETIRIFFGTKTFDLDVIQVKGSGGECDAVSIIETDVNVDFAPPSDAPAPVPVSAPRKKENEKASSKPPPTDESAPPTFVPFQGAGFRLDGKPCVAVASSSSSRSTSQSTSSSSSSVQTTSQPTSSSSSAAPSSPSSAAGKLVFGGKPSSPPPPPSTKPASASGQSSGEEAKGFTPFSGRGYSLR